ncbi:MAG: hypothetical protein J2P47_04225 [Acetobacteraceae bacterium]|nr:hypothetical protein [Acetobacteraceae bacterium]
MRVFIARFWPHSSRDRAAVKNGPPRGFAGAPNILLGVVLLARGRADGFDQFGNTTQAFLSSLAPLIAFPLVGSVLLLVGGSGLPALSDLFATFCALLAPPVISWELARLWGREGPWLRFATAFNWCQWAIPAVLSILLVILGALMELGLPNRIGGGLVLVGLLGYGLWLHWFLVRRGLSLSALRAALFVLAVNLGTGVLVVGPRLLSLVINAEQG